MKVYRIECRYDGNGPWMSDRQCSIPCAAKWLNSLAGHGTHPTPQVEGLVRLSVHKCGCRSMDDLRHWFPSPVFRALLADKYDLMEYDVPDSDVQIGEKQVVFNPSRATKRKIETPTQQGD